MAQNTVNKVIEIEFRNSELIEKLRNTQSAISSLNAETKQLKADLEEYRQALKKGSITQEQFDDRMARTKNEIVKNDQAVVKFKSDLRQYSREMQANIQKDMAKTGSLQQMRASVRLLTSEYEALSAAERSGARGQELVRQIRSTTDEITRQEAALRNYRSNVGNYAGGIQKAVLKISAAWIAVKGAFNAVKNSIAKIRDFEQANANLGTIVGANAEELQRLTDSALELGRTTEYTASQVTQLQTELAKLGFGTESIEAMQKPVLQFATAVGASLPDAAALAGATLRSFGLDVGDTEDVLSTLAAATNRSALSFSYLKTAMSIVSPVANTFGFSVRDTAALLGTLSDAGFDASSAATATRNILLNLADANGKLARSLGAPVRTLPELTAGLQRLRERGIDLAETLELTDKRSVAAFNTFLNGADSLQRLRKGLEDVDGELERIATERLNTVEGSIKLMESAWEGFVLSFYESKGAIKSVIDLITSGIEGINNLLNPDAQKNRQKAYFVEDLLKRYSAGGDDALKQSIESGLKYWETRYKSAQDRYMGSGGLFGKADFERAETLYRAFVEAGDAALDKVKQLKQEQADAARQAAADVEASAAAAARAQVEAADKARQADEKAAAAQVANARRAAEEVLRLRQQTREKSLDNDLLTLKENYDKEISSTRDRLAAIGEMEKSAGTELQAVLAGERESLNQKLLLLDEKYFRERQDLEQQYSEQSDQQAVKDRRDEYMELFSQKQFEYKNRILQAQLSGGDMGARQEALNIAKAELEVYKQQLQDVDTFESYYRDMGYSDIDIQTLRLQARIKVADAEDAIKKAQEESVQMGISKVQELIGAFGSLAEASGASAELAGVLAIAQSAAAMGMALSKAFSSEPSVWSAIAAAAAAISTIATVVSTIRSLGDSASDEGRKYRYAQGGLVTGPGSATSDSIPAMLSNGESVMTARATSEWGDLLSAINISSGGNAINVSNLPQRGDGMRGMRQMLREVLLDMPAPVVSVVDINKGQKRVKVSDNLGKLGRKKDK